MDVLRDGTSFTSGFFAEGLGAFFDGLIRLESSKPLHVISGAQVQCK